MRMFATLVALAWLAQPVSAQQETSTGSDDPLTDERDCPEDELPGGEAPPIQQPDGEEDAQTPGEQEPADDAAESVAGEWFLDYPEAQTPWQSDGTTFTSETGTWSEIFPLMADLALIFGPIEQTDGILPTFGLGLISEGEMSALAIRFLFVFPLVTTFEGQQVSIPPGQPGDDAEGDDGTESEAGGDQSDGQSGPESDSIATPDVNSPESTFLEGGSL